MLKASNSVNEIEQQAEIRLADLLHRVPALGVKEIKNVGSRDDRGIDLLAQVRSGSKDYTLIAQVKSSGQPRFAKEAINQLKVFISHAKGDEVPIFVAPFLSAQTQHLCREQGVGYLDFEGNAFVSFGLVYIERETASQPQAEKREIRSLFKPRSAQVLRIVLRDPRRSWKLSDLAAESGVSIGHVSNVRNALSDRDWLFNSESGFCLSAPDELLDAWQQQYRISASKQEKLYTPLHGKSWEAALRDFFRTASPNQAALASFSAAQWMAPYGRVSTNFLYVHLDATSKVKEALKLSRPELGENVILWSVEDRGVFTDSFYAADSIRCTSALQTFLDLSTAGERGVEAADHLRKAKFKWPK